MAVTPSPDDDDPRREPDGRPKDVVGLLSDVTKHRERTENLIRIIWTTAMAVVLIAIALFYVVIVVAKGVHGLSSWATWTPGGLLSVACLTRLVISRPGKRKRQRDDGAVGGPQTTPRALLKSRKQNLPGRRTRRSRRTRGQSGRRRKRLGKERSLLPFRACPTLGNRSVGAVDPVDRAPGSCLCAGGRPPAQACRSRCHRLASGVRSRLRVDYFTIRQIWVSIE
jgi:hypothetical protein